MLSPVSLRLTRHNRNSIAAVLALLEAELGFGERPTSRFAAAR